MSTHDAAMPLRRKYKVLIVDDHPIVRRGLADLIAGRADLEVCGEANGVAEHCARWRRPRPTWCWSI